MLKNILNLDGAQSLNKNEQKEINGGMLIGVGGGICPPNSYRSLLVCQSACGSGHCTPDYDNPNCFKCNYDHN